MFVKSIVAVALLATLSVAQGTTANSSIDATTVSATLRCQYILLPVAATKETHTH
jgi:hypothetical protein